jgi:type IV secretory pathway VirB2 component (pilin)
MKNMIIGLSVKAVTALENGRNWAYSGKLTHRKAFVMGMVVALASMTGEAAAQAAAATPKTSAADPVKNVTNAICNMTAILQGPIGIGVILGCVVIAGLSLAFGGKNSTSLLISALIGGAVVFGAKALLGLVAGNGSNNTCTPAAVT